MGMRRQGVLRTGVAIRLQLFSFHAHVTKLSKVLIKGRDWYVLNHCRGGDQTVDRVDLRSLIAVQSVQVDRHLTDLDARAADRKSDISADAQPQRRLRGFQRKTFLFPYCWQAHP
jgi:hypothetical protein